jgi:iron(III) transport system substrate-binding protein
MTRFRPTRRNATAIMLATAVSVTLGATTAQANGTINVYSYRQPVLIEPLFKAFSEATGIKVNYVFAKKGLVERLAQEAQNSPADVLLTSDVTRLVEASERGLVQPVASEAITGNVPDALRDKNNNWFGLTMRARVVYASSERVDASKMTYAELADPKWKGKLCIRSGQHPYNVGLFAAMIARKGTDATKAWLAGVKANLARKPVGNERAQAKAIFYGECDLAVANTYYMGKMATNEKEPEQKDWAKASRIIFPTWEDGTTHVNISGMALTKHAPNKDNAIKLMEYLASPQAQQIYAQGNFEYPVAAGVAPSELVKSWGDFTPDSLPIEKLAEYQSEASKLVDEVLFDQ